MTILFSDVVGFTEIAATHATAQIVMMLNEMFTRFDALCDLHGVYKVETIGALGRCSRAAVEHGGLRASAAGSAGRGVSFVCSCAFLRRRARLPLVPLGIKRGLYRWQ